MPTRKKNTYVLGTGLSHDGSACLMKDGKICFAIEKERITRRKHDGYIDTEAINYCLAAEGISLNDLDLVVQNANWGFFDYGNTYFKNDRRLFDDTVDVPIVTISHHLAHAYYALGTSPYRESAILVLDGCGSLYDECIDLGQGIIAPGHIPNDLKQVFAEKDSFYRHRDNQLSTLYKDFSPFGYHLKDYPMHPRTTKHSIGGLYYSATEYCVGLGSDPGKLMGLAPYGRPGQYHDEVFELKDGQVFVNYEWMRKFNNPVRSVDHFRKNFQHFADIAYWIQKEAERAILYLVKSRKALADTENFSYTGGVALNAVANGAIQRENIFKNVYFTPAASDNGLAIGCAYYGWLEVLKRERVLHDGNSCFGKVYPKEEIRQEIQNFVLPDKQAGATFVNAFFEYMPLFFNRNAIDRDGYVIQFVVAGVGVYTVQITRYDVSLMEGIPQKPDCVLLADGTTFANCLQDVSFLNQSLKEKKAVGRGDIAYFLDVVQLADLVRFVKNRLMDDEGVPKINFTEEADVAKKTAELLAEGNVIGWFQDGSEFGPRALGHRSILADPRKKGVQDFINAKVKFREDFRPFAPAVLENHVSEFFQFSGQSPYMIMVAQVQDKWKEVIRGVVHVDDSCRIQTVNKDWNEKFHALLEEFHALTGIPVLLNTSFNCKGMPVIETPAQALNYFFECGLDYLVMGNFIVSKAPSRANNVNRRMETIAEQ